MKRNDKRIMIFLELVRAGLWEKEARLSLFDKKDYSRVLSLAEEQSVVGLVTAGLEYVQDVKVPQEYLLQFVGKTLQIEEQNKAMNKFVAKLIEKLRKEDVYTILVKGQGIAQCYEKPLWRSCGDVDLLMSEANYHKAKAFLLPLASAAEPEGKYKKHLGMTIDQWAVELHGTLRCGISNKMDRGIDEIQRDIFYGGNIRSWQNALTTVFLPAPNNDVFFVFTHFLKHFYCGGIGLRQICDWCRLLWTYRETIDTTMVKKWLIKMGLMSEWKAFAAFAVDYLEMPVEAIPLYSADTKWKKKAALILSFIFMSGNLGHNRDRSYNKYPYLTRKFCSMSRRVGDLLNHARIFPMDSIKFMLNITVHGIQDAARGE